MHPIQPWFDAGFRRLAHLAPASAQMLRDDDALETYRSACAAAYQRAGIVALLWEGFAGWANVVTSAIRERLRRGSGSNRTPRRGGKMVDDFRHAWRRVTSRSAVSALAIGMLALAVGLTTAMFTLLDALLLRPAPFKDPRALVKLAMGNDRGSRGTVAPAVLKAWQGAGIFDSVQAVTSRESLLEGGGGVLARGSASVTPGLFDMLGVRPIRGRVFTADEGHAGADDLVMISEEVWQGAFGRDPEILGKRVTLDGRSMQVVGIMPAGFRFPAWDTVIWTPIDYQAPGPAHTDDPPAPFARLSKTMPVADSLRVATELALPLDPAMKGRWVISSALAGIRLDAYYKRALPILAGGVMLVFLVLCANVSSLLLAQYSTRRREFGVCSALGASRGRLLRQALFENILLGVAGAAAGVALAWALVAVSRGVLPHAFLLRTLNPMAVDLRALIAASIAGITATLAAGVLPAWIGTKPDSAESLRLVERTETPSKAARTTTRALLICEIALACTLLVGATLLARSFVNLVRADRGLNTHDVMTAWIDLPAGSHPDRASRLTATSALVEAVKAIPGVSQVVLSFGLPPGGGAIHFGDDWLSDIPGKPPLNLVVESYYVGSDFFSLYGIPLLRGRTFQRGDADTEVIVAERFAALMWPGVDPIGHTFKTGKDVHHVIGLVREINHPSVEPREDRPEYYETFSAGGSYPMMSIRCSGACPDGAMLRQKIVSAAPGSRIVSLGPLDDVYDEQLAPPRAAATLTSAFAAVALLAVAGGLFSVLSFAVGQRRREFGIRVALGAGPGSIRNLVMGEGVTVAIAGFAIGALAAWALGRALTSFEYGIRSSDPLSWALVTGLVLLTVLAAAWRPTRQAMRVNPASLLRE
ncbi:MAG TPA: FtsX-like permease family protein [Vicinamibacterales bacterium]|nr:FtsX-like permease family protein [Vicinamibacterales bacterium]